MQSPIPAASPVHRSVLRFTVLTILGDLYASEISHCVGLTF